MDELFLDVLLFFIVIGIAGFFIQQMRKSSSSTKQAAPQQAPADTTRLIEDMKMTQTSRIVDAIAVMDDLSETSKNSNYRHYCELIGTAMPSGGVIAPYSKREVAYYDLRCYRIENRNGCDVETLVAHEKSIDPFYITDGSGVEGAGESRVYVDLESFGNNCILINVTNRVEGPNSDFTKAISQATAQQGTSGSAYAMAANAIQAGRNVFAGAVQGVHSVLTGAPGLQSALATAGAPTFVTAGTRTVIDIPASAIGSNALFANNKNNMRRPGYGMGGVPNDLDIFLGGAFSSGSFGGFGGPKIYGGGRGDMGSLIGIGLGALLSSLATATPTTSTGSPQQQVSAFRGYRLIEDVVPLSGPIYCLGEIYRNGKDVYIGRSVSDSYPSSYFATKHEAEVINALK